MRPRSAFEPAVCAEAGCGRFPASACSSCARIISIRRRSCTIRNWAFGEELLAERYIPGRELTCAVMGHRALGVIDIVPTGALSFYNYESKYAPGGSRHVLPAQVSSNVYDLVRKLTLTAHKALGCRGVSERTSASTTPPAGPVS